MHAEFDCVVAHQLSVLDQEPQRFFPNVLVIYQQELQDLGSRRDAMRSLKGVIFASSGQR